jgi:lipoprotein signal peptidase
MSLPRYVSSGGRWIGGVPVPVLGPISFRLAQNTGPAFGPSLTLVSMIISALILLDTLRSAVKRRAKLGLVATCLGISLGVGAVDIVEWLYRGSTTEFISVAFKTSAFPTINLGLVIATVAAAIVLFTSVVLQTQSQDWSAHLSSFRNKRAVWGTVLRFASVPVFILATRFVVAGFSNLIAGILREPRGQLVLGILGIAVGAALVGAAGRLQHLGRRNQQPTLAEIRNCDRRPPVLFLRRYTTDALQIPRRGWIARIAIWRMDFVYDSGPWTFERALCDALQPIGPVIALGDPNERVQRLGASRTYVYGDDWREEVERLAQNAARYVVMLGDSPSMRFELELALRRPERFVAIPPDDSEGGVAAWAKLREDYPQLSAIDAKTAAVTFDVEWNATLIEATTPSLGSKLAALEQALVV